MVVKNKVFKFKYRLDVPIMSFLNGLIVDLPSPVNLSYWWSFGSLLGLFFVVQLLTGVFLAMKFIPDAELAYYSVDILMREVGGGWLLRSLHCNGASFYFLFLYLHMGRGLYYHSFVYVALWFSGLLMFVLSMGIAFFGYVLPWGKMSYWGAAVMTNLLSVMPYFGQSFVVWVWGGFSVVSPTLTRFFVLHFLLPFVVAALILVHFVLLHETGSKNSLGLNTNGDKVFFYPYYGVKDILGFVLGFMVLVFFSLGFPYMFLCSENFMEAKILSTPEHIEPDWFLLMPYAILRSMPNKLGGVIGLLCTILVLFVVPFIFFHDRRGVPFNLVLQTLFWFWVGVVLTLCWMGASPVDDPFIVVGQLCSVLYFFYFFFMSLIVKWRG